MAQTIHCDAEGHADVPADVLVTQIETGTVSAWCVASFRDYCEAIVVGYDQAMAEAQAADAEAAARLEGAEPGEGEAHGPDDGDDDDDEPAEGRLALDESAGGEGPQSEPDGLAGPSPDEPADAELTAAR